MQKKRILITGGTGFIGSHLAEALARTNQVWVTGKKTAPVPSKVAFLKADITKHHFLKLVATKKFDYIFHLAGNADQNRALRDPRADMEVNFLATFNLLNVLRQMRRPPRLIFASSVTVYGACEDRLLNEDASVLLPISNYGASKLAAERYLYAFVKQYAIPALTVRLFSTYGPGLRRQMVYDFMTKLKQNPEELAIFGTGQEARDLTYVTDQVATLIRVAQRGVFAGEVYNGASGKLYTTKQIAMAVARALKLKPHFNFTQASRVFDGAKWLADVSKIRQLNCHPTIPLQTGIKETVAWFNSL